MAAAEAHGDAASTAGSDDGYYSPRTLTSNEGDEEEWDDWAEIDKHDSFNCPLTLSLMSDPAQTIDGHTYEKSAIAEWLEHNDTSPMTGLVLSEKTLIPNLALKRAIEEYLSNENRARMTKHLEYKAMADQKLTPGANLDKRVNLLIVGPAGVGKSSLLAIMRGNEFSDKTDPTYGVDFSQHLYTTGSDTCRATIYDTSGQPHLKDTVRTQYKGTDCVMFVFDVTRKQTLHDLAAYIEAAKTDMSGRPHELILVGNKIDVVESREVSHEEVSNFVATHSLHDYREVSAKSGANVKLTFRNALAHSAYRAKRESGLPRPRARRGPPCCN